MTKNKMMELAITAFTIAYDNKAEELFIDDQSNVQSLEYTPLEIANMRFMVSLYKNMDEAKGTEILTKYVCELNNLPMKDREG